MLRRKYLIHTFPFLYHLFKSQKAEDFDFVYEPAFELIDNTPFSARQYVPKSFWALKKLYWQGKMEAYDVIQLNRPESYLAWQPNPNQVSVLELHGFDIGVMATKHFDERTATWKQVVARILDALLAPIIIRKIHKADLFYVSTPDLIEPITSWAKRTPIWLPNPIDTKTFNPSVVPKKLQGAPVCFLATRLQNYKAPWVGIEIFQKSILPQYPNAVLHLLTIGEYVEEYKKRFSDDAHYVWHDFMTWPELAAMMKGSDLVLGDFGQGTLSLIPMQAMACKVPVIALDNFEILKEIKKEGFGEISLRLLSDKAFRDAFVEKNYHYVMQKHSPEAIAATHFDRIEKLLKEKESKKI